LTLTPMMPAGAEPAQPVAAVGGVGM
jgi:hypothetical protein